MTDSPFVAPGWPEHPAEKPGAAGPGFTAPGFAEPPAPIITSPFTAPTFGPATEGMQTLADEFELRLGMLEWAFGVVRSMADQSNERIAEWLSDGSHLGRDEAERFVPRARRLLNDEAKPR